MEYQKLNRCLDVIGQDIVPLTSQMVRIGCKVFGAAILHKDMSLVLAATNHEAFSPLWHGEVYAIKQFWELQNHPDPADCIFIATHQPCCMCAAAIAWGGFKELYYFFGYAETGNNFNIPHDQRMIQELFNTKAPAENSSYYTSHSLLDAAKEHNTAEVNAKVQGLFQSYAKLSEIYQSGEKNMVLK